jgi:hypothetical protein
VFAVGVELPKAYMWRHWRSLFLLLVPVMTYGWIVSSAFIYWLIPALNFVSRLFHWFLICRLRRYVLELVLLRQTPSWLHRSWEKVNLQNVFRVISETYYQPSLVVMMAWPFRFYTLPCTLFSINIMLAEQSKIGY